MKVSAANAVRCDFAANAVKLVLALSLLWSLGCRSRSERDLVERELRMHEDQIYALEDYLAEYQEIVRRCRCENMELKRELERLQMAEANSGRRPPGQLQDLQDESWSPDRPRPRSLLDQRRSEPQSDPFRDDEPADDRSVPPAVPPVEPEAPEIELGPPVPGPPPAEPLPEQGTKASEMTEPLAPQIVPALVLSDALPLSSAASSPTAVRGELVTLEGQEIPSLHVEVAPRTADGQPLDYRGPLDVMLLDPAASESAPALARWEFTPDEVDDAWRDPQSRQVFDVLAGLPEGFPLERPLELWVRLRPEMGGKVLASTVLLPHEVANGALDLSEADHHVIDENVSPAGHWVPSQSSIPPKQASATAGGWLPRHE